MNRFATAPFAQRWSAMPAPAWPQAEVPTLAEILRRYSEQGSVLGHLDMPPPVVAQTESGESVAPEAAPPGPEFSEVLQGLQVRELASDVWLGELVRTAGT